MYLSTPSKTIHHFLIDYTKNILDTRNLCQYRPEILIFPFFSQLTTNLFTPKLRHLLPFSISTAGETLLLSSTTFSLLSPTSFSFLIHSSAHNFSSNISWLCCLDFLITLPCTHNCALLYLITILCTHYCALLYLITLPCTHNCALLYLIKLPCTHNCALLYLITLPCTHNCALFYLITLPCTHNCALLYLINNTSIYAKLDLNILYIAFHNKQKNIGQNLILPALFIKPLYHCGLFINVIENI